MMGTILAIAAAAGIVMLYVGPRGHHENVWHSTPELSLWHIFHDTFQK